ncbi:uncharacterized protein ARMOST_00765 [Armillaria ostoyae]|uniref:Uncharacterized protein n=1 Tax=Armillaria ostoyae TaxID=47428 RepID=A0A284QM28_ARMOS|nr:uncharacterized protein ARMOST_00765 [Armillaria ostoyae]
MSRNAEPVRASRVSILITLRDMPPHSGANVSGDTAKHAFYLPRQLSSISTYTYRFRTTDIRYSHHFRVGPTRHNILRHNATMHTPPTARTVLIPYSRWVIMNHQTTSFFKLS